MSQPLTIVMYHYVRDLAESRYPEIKALTLNEFQGQLGYLMKHYELIEIDDFIGALEKDGRRLPNNAAILTFDDGFIDHYINVSPLLKERGIQGYFFPSSAAIRNQKVLEVHKIQFLLASVPNKTDIVVELFKIMDEFRDDLGLASNRSIYSNYAIASRFDSAEVIFIKRALQVGLPEECRTEAIRRLFFRYVTEDEKSFAADLYMDVEQLKTMSEAGMYIGSHASDHTWLDSQSTAAQDQELELSLTLLEEIRGPSTHWGFNYPYGAYNNSLLDLLNAKGCTFGLTTEVDIADLDAGQPLLLPRLDTNDLPKTSNAPMNEWTTKVKY